MRKLFILFLLFVSASASAQQTSYWTSYFTGGGYRSAPEGCAAKAAGASWTLTGVTYSGDRSAACMGRNKTPTSPLPPVENKASLTRVGDGCPAPEVYNPTTFSCEPPPEVVDPCKDKLPFVRHFYYTGGVAIKPPTVWVGCMVNAEALAVCKTIPSGTNAGKKYCSWQMVRTGAKWDGDEVRNPVGEWATPEPTDVKLPVSPEIEADPQGNCPRGTVAAGRDSRDVQICIGTGTGESSTPAPQPKVETSRTRTNPDGSTTVTTTTTTTNADGSTTTATVEKTTTTGGQVLTSENEKTTTASDGSPGVPGGGTTTTPGDPAKNICQLNPSLTVCKNSSVSGACGAVTCSGDAIQCATLRAASAMQCQQEKELTDLQASPLTASGNAILSGADPQKAAVDAALAGSIVDVSKPNLDAAGFLGSSSCFPNRSIQVFGKSIPVSFASVCDSIHPLRFAILALSYLAAYLIIARSLLSD